MAKLLMIGTGDLSLDAFEHALRHQPVQKTIEPAYPQGLFLSAVKYPFFDIPPKSKLSSLQGTRPVEWIA